jgi:hypothetical protein
MLPGGASQRKLFSSTAPAARRLKSSGAWAFSRVPTGFEIGGDARGAEDMAALAKLRSGGFSHSLLNCQVKNIIATD